MGISLIKKTCTPCDSSTPPLTPDEIRQHLAQVPQWSLVEGAPPKIARMWKFADFREAMAFVNRIADLAEAENHHPDIAISYNRVTLTLWTHAIKGLSENDFILAAKIDLL